MEGEAQGDGVVRPRGAGGGGPEGLGGEAEGAWVVRPRGDGW